MKEIFICHFIFRLLIKKRDTHTHTQSFRSQSSGNMRLVSCSYMHYIRAVYRASVFLNFDNFEAPMLLIFNTLLNKKKVV